MDKISFVEKRVHKYYWGDEDINCANTTLRILSEWFNLELHSQVIDSSIGMHGAGGYRAQCGLVEGVLMFLGIFGRSRGFPDEKTIDLCKLFAQQFKAQFGSILCEILRPEGFKPENPPHLCAPLTCKAIVFDIDFISDLPPQTDP